MKNKDFLNCILRSFNKFLETGSRSNQKLKILHGDIASNLSSELGTDYKVQSLGYGKGKEGKIQGRYINKNVDITISKDGKVIAGIGIKFVMQNYSQNSNNYFENMLGETANIRSNNILYFQILVIPDKMPYFKKDGIIKSWETFTLLNAKKYETLSKDLVETSIHTPSKTLLYVIKLPEIKTEIKNKTEYRSYYQSLRNTVIELTDKTYESFDSNVILNDYETFIKKMVFRMKSI